METLRGFFVPWLPCKARLCCSTQDGCHLYQPDSEACWPNILCVLLHASISQCVKGTPLIKRGYFGVWGFLLKTCISFLQVQTF